MAGIVVEFLIQAVIYGFGLALLLRQFCGVYEDFIITVGRPACCSGKPAIPISRKRRAGTAEAGKCESGLRRRAEAFCRSLCPRSR